MVVAVVASAAYVADDLAGGGFGHRVGNGLRRRRRPQHRRQSSSARSGNGSRGLGNSSSNSILQWHMYVCMYVCMYTHVAAYPCMGRHGA